MSIRSIDDLLAALKKSRLVSSDQMSLVIETVRSQASPAEGLARLVEQGLVTSWQSERLLAGLVSFSVDRYKLLEQIGQGGMGAVFKAEHTVMGRTVALKVLSNARLQNSAAVARFRREVKAAAALDHPNIITAHDAGEVAGIHYLVMEYVAGADLNAWNKAHGHLPYVWAAEFVRQAALGLEHARKLGMVHRDIKPGNILVSWDDPQKLPTVKILDLGLARFIRDEENDKNAGLSGTDLLKENLPPPGPSSTMDENLTQFGQVLGTPDYLAPEQIQRTHDVDIRADIFSLGCTMFKILTGQLPFGGTTVWEKLEARTNPSAPPAILLRSLRPDVPAGLESITARMLARDPAARYQTPGELAAELEPFGWAATLAAGASAFDPGEHAGGFGPGFSSPNGASSMSLVFMRTSSHEDSGTRAFLGALAVEDDEPSSSAPPAAPPVAAIPAGVPAPVANLLPASPPTGIPVAGIPIAPAASVPMASVPARPLRPLPQFATAHEETIPDADAPTRERGDWQTDNDLAAVDVMGGRSGRPRSELDARREELLRRRRRKSAMPVVIAGLVSVGVVGLGLWMASGSLSAPARPSDAVAKGEPKKTIQLDPAKHSHSRTDDWRNLPKWTPEKTSEKHGHSDKGHERPHGEKGPSDKGEKRPGEKSEEEPPEKVAKEEPPKSEPPKGEPPPKKLPASAGTTSPRSSWRPLPVDPNLELILEGHTREATSVAISPDGRMAISGSLDQTVRYWDLATGEELQVFEGHEDGVTAVAFLSGGVRACSASRDMTVRVWDLVKPRQAYLLRGHTAPVMHLSTTPDSTTGLVTGGEDAVRVWNVASGTNRFSEHQGEALVAVKYSNTGPRAFYGSGSDPLRCYNAVTREELFHIRGAPQVNAVAVSRDARLLAEGLAMGVISILDVKQLGSDGANYKAHEGGVLSLTFTTDSDYVVSGGADKNVLVRKVDGSQMAVLKGHTAPVTSVAVSRDGEWILSGSQDRTLRLWRFPGGKAPTTSE